MTPEIIVDFWFEKINNDTIAKSNQSPFNKWFSSSQEFDQLIKDRFLATYEKAKENGCKSWGETAQGKLALILIFDQFNRNMFRGTPLMYQTDKKALELTLDIIKNNEDALYNLFERIFIYMPLMHAENIHHQKKSVECFTKLLADCLKTSPSNANYFKNHLRHAENFHKTIQEFGLFPQRQTG